MCIAYEPFKWADNYQSEEEFMNEIEEENMTNKIEIDLDAITVRRDELMDLEARYKFELKQIEKEKEKLDLQLIALIDQMQVDSMDYKTYSFGWKTTTRTALDQKYLKEHYSDIANKCTFTKESKNFEFEINK